MVEYLETPIEMVIRDDNPPKYGMCADGYTKRSGAPSSYRILLKGESRFRRVMVRQFSNVGTAFVRIKGKEYVVRESDLGI